MRMRYLSFLSLLVPAFFLLSGHAVLKAQQGSSSAVKGGRWSDSATWADKKVPAEGATVTVDKGMKNNLSFPLSRPGMRTGPSNSKP